MEITGHPSKDALADWCRRYNAKSKDHRIVRRPGFIEQHSLEAALLATAREFDQVERVNAVVAKLGRKRSSARVMDVRRTA
jgi:hypothetical protein